MSETYKTLLYFGLLSLSVLWQTREVYQFGFRKIPRATNKVCYTEASPGRRAGLEERALDAAEAGADRVHQVAPDGRVRHSSFAGLRDDKNYAPDRARISPR